MTSAARRTGFVTAVLFGAGAMVGCAARSAGTPLPATAAGAAADAAAGLMEHHRTTTAAWRSGSQ